MPVIEASDAEVIVVADADVWTDGLERGIRALVCGVAEWVVPHRRVLRLSEASTDELLATGQPGRELARGSYDGKLGGGVVIARRESLLSVPMDCRFEGWGHEDDAFACALETMLGFCWRGDADLLHLYHPKQSRLSRKVGSTESYALYRRYALALGKPEEMSELLEGAK
jgi:hypothetical protein